MNACCWGAFVARQLKRADMGTIIEFPAGRRVGSSGDVAPRADMGTVLILPVIRIEREADETSGDRGPEQGTAPGRRRRRR
ncbi:hypothetical protein ABIE73_005396 [Bradyrhizobium yuanmingense]